MTTTPPPTELAKQYRPEDVESQVAQRWQDADAFHACPKAGGKPYAIVIPPPNVTAALHMGHALNNTLQDILIRWHRMLGDNAMWMPGTDHAGIATQTVVDKRLQAEDKPALKDYKKIEADGGGGREQFIEKVQAWKDEYEGVITGQLKSMGCSCDWERQRFTMDPTCAKAVREAFFRLFKDGLIYRGKRLVNWDPATQTALADDEVESQDVDGHFYYMKYPVIDDAGNPTGEFVTVATTRPETMLGDTAVAVNPRDTKHGQFIGKRVALPIVGRHIPIIGDDYVVIPDPDSDDAKARMASGFLKVTPAHDPNDWEIGLRNGLDVVNVMAPDGSISKDHGWDDFDHWPNSPEADATMLDSLLGQSREQARKSIVKWFETHGLLEEIKPYRHAVGHSYRSHVPIEPYLSDQWYVKVTDDRLRGAAIDAMVSDQRTPLSESYLYERKLNREENQQTSRGRKPAVPTVPAPPSPTSPKDQTTYLITFTTYGTWLHGDKRGSIDPEHNLPGEPFLHGDPQREQAEYHKLKHNPTTLTEPMRQVVQQTFLEVAQHRGWTLLAANIRTNHAHVVISADAPPERVMGDLKSYATRRLREAGLLDAEQPAWTRHGSTRYLNDDTYVKNSIRYVIKRQGAAMQPAPYHNESSAAPSTTSRAQTSRGRKPAVSPDTPVSPNNTDTHDTPRAHAHGSSECRDQLRFYPERYARTFQHWHENLRDWCISRQLWWGHRIPVWGHRSLPGAVDADDIFEMYQTLMRWESEGRLSHQLRSGNDPSLVDSPKGETDWKRRFICVRSEDDCEIVEFLERWGFTQDPDVLDTWFSSALWPMSTLGWPEDTAELATWSPSNVLCTAREIITLWVSRMVMFNTYLHGKLPFTDVFIHAMIQDGHGQKMSKSLGNGVDPNDIIHSHGSDAMRFTLTSMTTQTQDVRMPVDMVCPHTGKMFTPKFVITGAHQSKVAAPVQDSPFAKGKQMVSSFGLATGQAKPSEPGGDMPLARNTSEKFDYGRNFANKLWNATRFALSKLEEADDTEGAPGLSLGLADRWILSRTARTIEEVNTALENYDFHNYAGRLYQFVWNDVCDWYIEAVKPTIGAAEGARSRQVLAVVLDVSLRMLHPSMPFITEKLWESLSAVAPKRGVRGLDPQENELLVTAEWPTVDRALVDLQAEENFERMRTLVTMIREVRTANKVPPRETVDVSVKLAKELVGLVGPQQGLIESLTNVKVVAIGPEIEKPDDAAVIVRPLAEVYLHNQLDADAEKTRLTKHLAEVSGQVKNLEGRLSNEKYTSKAPAHLVQESRDKLAGMIRERDAVKKQLEELG